MTKLTTIVAVATLAIASVASADDKKPADPKAAGAKAAPPAAPEMGKPAAELQQYKMMIGDWKCAGKGTMGGKEMKGTSTYKAAWDLDGHWVVAHFEGKMEGMPGAHKGLDVYGWDPINKMYVSISVDNMGGWSMSKSKGWEGDKQEWAGKGMMMGKESDMKWTVTKKGDKEITINGTMGTDMSFEDNCKK